MNRSTKSGLKAGLITASLAAASIVTAVLTAPSGATAASTPALVVVQGPNQPPVNDLVTEIDLPSGATVPVHASASDPDITGVNDKLPVQVTLAAGTGDLSLDTTTTTTTPPPCFGGGSKSAPRFNNCCFPSFSPNSRNAPRISSICLARVAPRALPGGAVLLVGTGHHDRTMTIFGYPSAVDLALGSLVYTAPDLGPGVDTITMTTNDLGNAGTGGPLTTISHTHVVIGQRITTTPATDASVLTQTPQALPGCKIFVSGVLSPSYKRMVRVTLSTTAGKALQIFDLVPGLNDKFSVLSAALPCNTNIKVTSASAATSTASAAAAGPDTVLAH